MEFSLGWAEYVAGMGDEQCLQNRRISWKISGRKSHLEVDERIILKLKLEKWDVKL
jgi:hypothetical protein